MPVSRRRIVILGSLAALVVAGIVIALGSGLWLLLLETGKYPVSHGFRIDGKAWRALQEAGESHPNVHLVMVTGGYFPGEVTFESKFASEFDDRDRVTLQTRGVTFEVEKHIYEKYRILRPVVSHRGDKPLTDYKLYLPGSRPRSGLDH